MTTTLNNSDLVRLLQNSNTSGTYRYFSYAIQNDFNKDKITKGMSYFNQLEINGWKTYFLENSFYAYKKFTEVGSHSFSITPFENKTANVLVVAGGGGGGGQHGGAGGAGGYVLTNVDFRSSQLNAFVGQGGGGATAGQSTIRGSNGENSSLGEIVAVGGGGGGTSSGNGTGASGGSGGGGSIGHSSGSGDNQTYNSTSQRGRRGIGVAGQGNDGGGGWHASPGYPGGGGGGAASPGGEKSSSTSGGNGGGGLSNTILGYQRFFSVI
jgi:hypothetical protein